MSAPFLSPTPDRSSHPQLRPAASTAPFLIGSFAIGYAQLGALIGI